MDLVDEYPAVIRHGSQFAGDTVEVEICVVTEGGTPQSLQEKQKRLCREGNFICPGTDPGLEPGR